jgi:hypothetical protein
LCENPATGFALTITMAAGDADEEKNAKFRRKRLRRSIVAAVAEAITKNVL